jgi:hypothetical protein
MNCTQTHFFHRFDDLAHSVPHLYTISCRSRCNCIPESFFSTDWISTALCDSIIRFISITRGDSALRPHLSQIPATRRIPSCGTAVQMPCHPFQVDEVFRFIVEQLVALSPRCVLSLALCCKSLTDMSLSVLWERQKRLSTLIKVLPPDAWTYQETDSTAGELVGRPHFHDHPVINAQPSVL